MASKLSKNTVEGQLVALSSGELGGYDYQLMNQPVILKMELRMDPLPFTANS
jgi:hypothetical protein